MKVAFDNRAITIDGKRELLISGAIHYPRSTPFMWPELMQRSKDCGLNCIETYIFWNLHERKRGSLDFTGRLNLREFCEKAQAEGLKVILRIGPYICAETNFGGLPPWLCEIENLRTRTWNKLFMDEMERWVTALAEYIRPLLIDNGGPVILAQFENEYANIGEGYGEDGQRYVEWAIELGQRLKLGVPLIMCEGSAPGALETINGFFGAERIPEHRAKHPDQPAIWTENWPGWYNCWGYQRHCRQPEEVAYRLVHFIAAGGTGVNYYMWHAGTNFGRESMYLQTSEYGFNAPFDEQGNETALSRYLSKVHALLWENAGLILASDNPSVQVVNESVEVYRLSDGKEELVFLCNTGKKECAEISWEGAEYSLKPLSIQILKNNQLILDTSAVETQPVNEKLNELDGVISEFSFWPEPLPSKRPEMLDNSCVYDQPVNQLLLTHDESDYCWYSTEIEIAENEAGQGVLSINGAGDFLYVYIDGVLVVCSKTPLAENRILDIERETSWPGPGFYLESLKAVPEELADKVHFRENFNLNLSQGKHRIDILCTALGLIKGDWMLGYNNMVFERKGIWGTVSWQNRFLNGPWTLHPGLVGEKNGIFSETGYKVDWQKEIFSNIYWLKTEFKKPEGCHGLLLDLNGMNKGMIWLNGQCLGRYWLLNATLRNPISPGYPVLTYGEGEPTQRYYHLPLEWLRENNTIHLFEESGGTPEKIIICTKINY